MTELLRPAASWEMAGMIEGLAARGASVEVVGGGSKRAVGRPVGAHALVTTIALRGVTMYEPAELVMTARAGTALANVESELAARGQMLAFEPIDLGPAIGAAAGRQTIGAVFSANLSGARRIAKGAARDHILGVKAVNGRGELFQAGGRVMKNVTGYDLSRALTGSWGTLAVLTDVTFKVMPAPEDSATLVYFGLPDDLGVELLCSAFRSQYEVSGAVHLPETMAARIENEAVASEGKAATAVRIENFARSVAYRVEKLKTHLQVYGPPMQLDGEESTLFWGELRRLSVVANKPSLLWRISTAPSSGPKLVASIQRNMQADAFYDWSGGLIWLETPLSADAGAADIRRVVALHGGHATLVRAAAEVREAVDVFPTLSPGLEKLTRSLKKAFDPGGVLNPGRMYSYV